MKRMETILAKVYDNDSLRQTVVPLFIGNPGMGKTKIIEKFAKERGAKLVELITSQMSPFEISGIAMPDKDTKKMTYFNFDKLEELKDGDILFFDELLNGNPVVLNACLTILEQRRFISGKELPNVMIIAAANPQGMVPLTPQIKERFLWYNVVFDPEMWQDYMHKKYEMPKIISGRLCETIQSEEFRNNNFYTPRSIDKAVNMIKLDCPTPYADVVNEILSETINNRSLDREIKINDEITLKPLESIEWVNVLKGETASIDSSLRLEPLKKKYEIFITGYEKGSKGKAVEYIREIKHLSRANAKYTLESIEEKSVKMSIGERSERYMEALEKTLPSVGIKYEVKELHVESLTLTVDNSYNMDKSLLISYLKSSLAFTNKELEEFVSKSSWRIASSKNIKYLELIKSDLYNLGIKANIN